MPNLKWRFLFIRNLSNVIYSIVSVLYFCFCVNHTKWTILEFLYLWKTNLQLFYRKVCVGSPAARHSKPSQQARLVEKKVCLISDACDSGGGSQTSVQRPTPPSTSRGWEHYRQSGRGWGGATCRNSTVIFKLVISGLTSIILVVLGTVNLQFWGALVPISLGTFLGIVAVQALGTVWSSCS